MVRTFKVHSVGNFQIYSAVLLTLVYHFVVKFLSHVWLFAIPETAAHWASLSFTTSWSSSYYTLYRASEVSLVVTIPPTNARDIRDASSIPGLGLNLQVPWRRAQQPTLVFLLGESHGQRSLVACSPWGHKESDMAKWLNWTENVSMDRNNILIILVICVSRNGIIVVIIFAFLYIFFSLK